MNTFDAYCRACRAEGASRIRAALVTEVRSFFIAVQDLDAGIDEEKRGYVDLYSLLRLAPVGTDDEITRITRSASAACRHIAAHLRERILREDVTTPHYKVREISARGVGWLSKRPGRTVREKLSGTNSMLAVRRRPSIDTGENRLFMAFVRRLDALIAQKKELPGITLSPAEEDFHAWVQRILHDETLQEIGAWRNTPPNNTLLGERRYRIVWRNWRALQELDALIAADDAHLDERITTMLLWRLARRLGAAYGFTQQPIRYHYRKGRVLSVLGHIDARNADGTVRLRLHGCSVSVTYRKKIYQLQVKDMRLIDMRGDAHAVAPGGMDALAAMIAARLGCPRSASLPEQAPPAEERRPSAYVDLFALRPSYLTGAGEAQQLSVRIMRQQFVRRGAKHAYVYDVPVDEAASVRMRSEHARGVDIRTYSVVSCVNKKQDGDNQEENLLAILRRHVPADRICIPQPDAYSDFSLRRLREALRVRYGKEERMPRSIAFLFEETRRPTFWRKFRFDDFVLLVDCVQDRCTLTLVQGRKDERVENALPESKGLVWERHPTRQGEIRFDDGTDLHTRCRVALEKRGVPSGDAVLDVVDVDGLRAEQGRLYIDFGMRGYSLDESLEKDLLLPKPGIKGIVQAFQTKYDVLLRGRKVHVYVLTDRLICDAPGAEQVSSPARVLEGMRRYDELRHTMESYRRTHDAYEELCLWHDHLPALGIKRLYGVFDLISEEVDKVVKPQLNKEQEISIPHGFTLPRGQREYRFGLIMNSVSHDITHEAVVRHPSFPLDADTECRLRLTYTYGKDIPYELVFEPRDGGAPFRRVEVRWEEAKARPLPGNMPTFPQGAEDWNTLIHGATKKKSDVDLLGWLRRDLNRAISLRTVIRCKDCQKFSYHEYDNRPNILALRMEIDGTPSVVRIVDPKGVLENVRDGAFSCLLTQENRERYVIDFHGEELVRGDAIIKDVNVRGETRTVRFFKNNFLFEEEWNNGRIQGRVSFEISAKENRYKAINVAVEGDGCVFYTGTFPLREAVTHHLASSIFFPLHTVFFNGRSFHAPAAPEAFRQTMEQVAAELPGAFARLRNEKKPNQQMSGIFFRVICTLAPSVGRQFYEVIYDVLEHMPQIVDDDLGCALSAYDTVEAQELLGRLMASKSITSQRKIWILSRAAWKHEDFVRNAPSDILIKYFEEAVGIVSQKGGNERNMLKFLEYILGVFRLRERGDIEINRRLSLDNSYMRTLYHAVEEMIASGYRLPVSRIKFDVHQSAEYEKDRIDDFYYALLVYITGDTGQGHIGITKIAEGEED